MQVRPYYIYYRKLPHAYIRVETHTLKSVTMVNSWSNTLTQDIGLWLGHDKNVIIPYIFWTKVIITLMMQVFIVM